MSDNLSNVVMKIVNGGSITKTDLNSLNQGDRQIYDRLLKMSCLHKDNEHTFDESSKHMSERLRLIEGEVNAGNDSPELLREAHGILHSMANCKLISTRAAASHYKHLLSFFK